jgi:four helix bundle protein
MSSYKDLDVWKKSFTLCVDVYSLTQTFPKEEIYGLTSQIRRASVSIPSNISEGSKRGRKEFLYFLKIAHGSGAELETQIMLAHELDYIQDDAFQKISQDLTDIMRMLSAFIKKLSIPNDQLPNE